MSNRSYSLVCFAALVTLLAGCAGPSLTPAIPAPAPAAAPPVPHDVDTTPAPKNTQRQPVLLNTDFKTVQDESIDLRSEGPLRIYLHQGPIHDKTAP